MSVKLRTTAWMAWRYLIARKSGSGLSFMTVVSILGVAIGVAALIIVLSVMAGFEQDLTNKMLAGEPHLEITAQNASAGFSLKQFPLENFKQAYPEAKDAEPYVEADVVLKQGKHLDGVNLFGVDPNRNSHLWGFGDAMTSGVIKSVGGMHAPLVSEDPTQQWPGIVLGDDLALTLGAHIGDKIVALSPQGATSGGSLTGATVSRTYVVVGTFRTGLFNYDAKWAVVSIAEGRKFMADYDQSLDEEEYVSGVAMNFADPFEVENYASRVQQFAGLRALTWQMTNKSLLFALKLEKFAMGAILMLIVVVAAFSISGTMMMTVFHKRLQVSLLRSIGMTRGDIRRLFMWHGFTIGAVGILSGVAAGVGVCYLISYFKFIHLPDGIYYLKALPVRFLPTNYAVISALAFLFSLLAATYPALTAARQDPSRGLRYE